MCGTDKTNKQAGSIANVLKLCHEWELPVQAKDTLFNYASFITGVSVENLERLAMDEARHDLSNTFIIA